MTTKTREREHAETEAPKRGILHRVPQPGMTSIDPEPPSALPDEAGSDDGPDEDRGRLGRLRGWIDRRRPARD